MVGWSEELQEKWRRVVEYLERKGLDGVLLTRQDNFSWFTGGKDNHVATVEDAGAATLYITKEDVTLITTNIEAPRLLVEEISDYGYQLKSVPWYEGTEAAIQDLIAGKKVGSDTGFPGTVDIMGDFPTLRYCLTQNEVKRIKALGLKTGRAVEYTCQTIEPGQTEHEIAAVMCQRLLAQGITPTVALVAVDERIEKFRHPIPTDKRLEKYAMLVVCARQGGLTVAATRLVHFGALSDELRKKHEAVIRIDATLMANTRVGVTVGDILRKGIAAYEAEGFAGEWKLHHQGGPCGYANREYLAVPDCTAIVQCNQAFAWNPSITGTKSEDTILVTETGVEIITSTGDWPAVSVEVNGKLYPRPEILLR